MNYNEHNQTNEFLDSLASNSFIPLILQPTRITSHSNTLIDNIFSNVIEPDIISGNLTATVSDHLPQFAIIPNIFGNISGNKYNIYERDWSKFDQENFILDYFSVDWEDLLKIDKLNADNSTKMYLSTNPYDIANTFNNYFASIAETLKKNIKYSHKHFSDYLANENGNSIFLQPTDKEEIANIISSLNSNKASGPNSIPYRILLLLKNEIS